MFMQLYIKICSQSYLTYHLSNELSQRIPKGSYSPPNAMVNFCVIKCPSSHLCEKCNYTELTGIIFLQKYNEIQTVPTFLCMRHEILSESHILCQWYVFFSTILLTSLA